VLLKRACLAMMCHGFFWTYLICFGGNDDKYWQLDLGHPILKRIKYMSIYVCRNDVNNGFLFWARLLPPYNPSFRRSGNSARTKWNMQSWLLTTVSTILSFPVDRCFLKHGSKSEVLWWINTWRVTHQWPCTVVLHVGGRLKIGQSEIPWLIMVVNDI
jgi:hypothetical protein